MSVVQLAGTFSGTGQSADVVVQGLATVLLYGGAGTLAIQKSYDGGRTWRTISKDIDGNAAPYALNASEIVVMLEEPEAGVRYRITCTAHTSGTLGYRISR